MMRRISQWTLPSALPRALIVSLVLSSGAAVAQDADDAPADAPAPAPAPEWTDADLAALEEHEADYLRWKEAGDLHLSRIQQILYREYLSRKGELEKRYSERIEEAEAEQRKRSLDAIRLLEEFIAKYPDHQEFTPDAMFRLAELYLDEANYQYGKEQELAAAGFKDGTKPPPPEEDEPLEDGELPAYDGPDYSKSLTLWRTIIEKFPSYRQLDGTLYLYGYYLREIGEERKATQVYLGLVCANKYKPLDPPKPEPTREEIRAKLERKEAFLGYEDCESMAGYPELVEEAWVRGIGDTHFNTAGELPEAIAAYRKASHKESKFYDEALYKLAWSYYRNDNFMEGITAFDESVVYSDKIEDEGGEPLELRNEAITYIAISFTDPWSPDEPQDPVKSYDRAFAFYKDRFGERHVRDVFEQLGDTFKILQAWEQAIDSWRIVVNEYPLHPRAPQVHQKIVSAYEAMGDKDAADEEAAKLARRYGPGTEWYKANETNPEAMESQEKIGQRMLRASAENAHRAAIAARDEWKAAQTEENKAAYIVKYAEAAALYQEYLLQYPDADEIYEFTYRIADCLFFSEQYEKAVPVYRWVRDHKDLGTKYHVKAAESIVLSYELEVDKQIKEGKLVEPPLPTEDSLKGMGAPGSIEPQPIPQVFLDLQAAYDEYAATVDDPKTAPERGLAAALISFRYLHFDDAIRRFELVMDKFCGSQELVRAKDGLLVIYGARGEAEKFKATNKRFIESECASPVDVETARAQNRSLEFEEAEGLFKDKKYDAAAIAFYRYYKTAPDDDPNLPVALYNSAIAYERSGRPKTAIFLFDEFTQNPRESFRKSPYYVEALYLTAVAYQKAFDYQAAVDVYLNVVKVAGEKGRDEPPGKRSLRQIQLDSLFNAALLRELDRVYKDPRAQPGTGAVSLYRRYYDMETDRRKKDRALWAIARVYESSQDIRNMEKTYSEWRSVYGRDAGNEQDYVYTYYNAARMYAKKGDSKNADKARRETIKAWATVGSPTGTPTAEMAAEYEFYYAEIQYKKFERFEFSWPKDAATNEKSVTKTLNAFDKLVADTEQLYSDIGKYESGFWGVAALVRQGDIQYFSAQKMILAKMPKELAKLDEKYPDRGYLDQWMSTVEGLVQPKIDLGVNRWKKVTTTAQQAGVSNKWTKMAQERLHDYVSPEQYPTLRQEIIDTTETP